MGRHGFTSVLQGGKLRPGGHDWLALRSPGKRDGASVTIQALFLANLNFPVAHKALPCLLPLGPCTHLTLFWNLPWSSSSSFGFQLKHDKKPTLTPYFQNNPLY